MNSVSSRPGLSLDGTQMRRVLELLELHAESPARARQALDSLVQAEALPASLRTGVTALFALGRAEADRALNAACSDDEAVECLLQLRTHEARLEFVGDSARRKVTRTGAAA
ncbi:hypothetical protein [Variovorax sp.]|uniref:hypothetical protein n=1 Tax=Variovorax sp. TaxID=1871043 RepID=UPI002D2EC838|nr:hypothetical protein [Variovorax sp.]HYP83533.1 hypothetical protein [Variovorax sp.]